MEEQISRMLEAMQAQQQTIDRLLNARQQPPAANEALQHDAITTKVKNLADSMVQFIYDPDSNQTFEAYYNRYESVLTTQANGLDEPTKVHLLLQKLQQMEYQRYADSILPLKLHERTLAETVTELKRLFGYKETKFAMRHKCFGLSKLDSDSLSVKSLVITLLESTKM